MPVQRTGGVITAGGTKPIAQPSTPPSVRADVSPFNVPLDRDLFTQLIKAHGYDVTWEKATLCPFLKGPNPKDHDVNCAVCKNGFIYFEPIDTRMHIASLGLQQMYWAYGHIDSGKAQITAFPEFKVSFWDRITLKTSRVRHTDRVRRLRNTNRDRPQFDPLSISDLRWALDDGKSMGLAVQGVDFDIDAVSGEIIWKTTNRPGADVWYSVVYYFRPQYIVLELPHFVRDQPIPNAQDVNAQYEFPVQVIAQMDRFFRDEQDPNNESNVTNPFPTQGKARWQGA